MWAIILVLLILLIVYFTLSSSENLRAWKEEEDKAEADARKPRPYINFYQLSDKQKMDYVIKYVGHAPPPTLPPLPIAAKTNPAVSNPTLKVPGADNATPISPTTAPAPLPACEDLYSECSKWAGDCDVNPEHMYYICPKTCNVCNLSPEEKYKEVVRLNKLPPKHCVFRGYGWNYPNVLPYQLAEYNYVAQEVRNFG